MQLSPETLLILKNFADINEGIIIKKNSNKLTTVSSQTTILGSAEVPDKFPVQVVLHSLPTFLAISAGATDFDFQDDQVIIKNVHGKDKIVYAKESLVKAAPDKTITMPDVAVSFELSDKQFKHIASKASILGLPNILVTETEDGLVMQAVDRKNPSTNTASVLLTKDKTGKDFKFYFLTDNFKLMDDTYKVEISSKALSHFTSTTRKVDYFIALEKEGTYYKE